MSGTRVRPAAEDVLLEDSDPLVWYGQAMVRSRDMAVIATGLHVLRTGPHEVPIAFARKSVRTANIGRC